MLRIKESTVVQPTPTDSVINDFSEYFRVTLPLEYITFIKEYNGVVVENAAFIANGREYMIERFLNILDDIHSHFDGMYAIEVVISQIEDRLISDDDMLGTDIVPIANVFAGDMVCLDYRNNVDEPTVCVWSHEESYDSHPVTYMIADNFGEFLKML